MDDRSSSSINAITSPSYRSSEGIASSLGSGSSDGSSPTGFRMDLDKNDDTLVTDMDNDDKASVQVLTPL
jgi:hypothetical protein